MRRLFNRSLARPKGEQPFTKATLLYRPVEHSGAEQAPRLVQGLSKRTREHPKGACSALGLQTVGAVGARRRRGAEGALVQPKVEQEAPKALARRARFVQAARVLSFVEQAPRPELSMRRLFNRRLNTPELSMRRLFNRRLITPEVSC